MSQDLDLDPYRTTPPSGPIVLHPPLIGVYPAQFATFIAGISPEPGPRVWLHPDMLLGIQPCEPTATQVLLGDDQHLWIGASASDLATAITLVHTVPIPPLPMTDAADRRAALLHMLRSTPAWTDAIGPTAGDSRDGIAELINIETRCLQLAGGLLSGGNASIARFLSLVPSLLIDLPIEPHACQRVLTLLNWMTTIRGVAVVATSLPYRLAVKPRPSFRAQCDDLPTYT